MSSDQPNVIDLTAIAGGRQAAEDLSVQAERVMIRWQTHVWHDETLIPQEKLLLLAMAAFANDAMYVHIKHLPMLYRMTCLCEREVDMLLSWGHGHYTEWQSEDEVRLVFP